MAKAKKSKTDADTEATRKRHLRSVRDGKTQHGPAGRSLANRSLGRLKQAKKKK